ncbi:hypothetical protein EYF80_015063 [Liparis tanakae]|uniref:Uncharacterized protein n=1 Tax=Liparis tanakae TaxID=230148 RepID=A0A4Z2IBB7_9TELE|nr:hypothetical protein EYF80_015063 [Liparis tanakae]
MLQHTPVDGFLVLLSVLFQFRDLLTSSFSLSAAPGRTSGGLFELVLQTDVLFLHKSDLAGQLADRVQALDCKASGSKSLPVLLVPDWYPEDPEDRSAQSLTGRTGPRFHCGAGLQAAAERRRLVPVVGGRQEGRGVGLLAGERETLKRFGLGSGEP